MDEQQIKKWMKETEPKLRQQLMGAFACRRDAAQWLEGMFPHASPDLLDLYDHLTNMEVILNHMQDIIAQFEQVENEG